MIDVTQSARDAAADVWHDYVAKIGECIVENSIRKGGMDESNLVQAFAAAEQRGMIAAREIDELPSDIAEILQHIGEAEWGQTPAHTAEGHGDHVAESVRKTAEYFGQHSPQHMNGLYIKGTGTVICHTGTSPNSPQIARALTGAWNFLRAQAIATMPMTAGGEDA